VATIPSLNIQAYLVSRHLERLNKTKDLCGWVFPELYGGVQNTQAQL
jgi:hypothetical protein